MGMPRVPIAAAFDEHCLGAICHRYFPEYLLCFRGLLLAVFACHASTELHSAMLLLTLMPRLRDALLEEKNPPVHLATTAMVRLRGATLKEVQLRIAQFFLS